MSTAPVLPLRPMTVGELLDAAAILLRSRWKALLGLALVFAFVDQILMTTLRLTTAEMVVPGAIVSGVVDSAVLWTWVVAGLTTEIIAVTLLSGPAARTAVAAVSGDDPKRLPFWTIDGNDWGKAFPVAAISGFLGLFVFTMCFSPFFAVDLEGLAAAVFPSAFAVLPWLFVVSMFGLAVPAIVADRLPVGRALGRTFQLLARSHWRTAWIRMLTFTSWILVRVAITLAAYWAVDSVDFLAIPFRVFLVVLGVVYLAINTVAYAMMACVDAVTLVETRVRVEGLDVAVSRMRARGEPVRLNSAETP
ncbi:MAG: hypothetical protein ACRDXX_03015 [Stackebrandtia sp.]